MALYEAQSEYLNRNLDDSYIVTKYGDIADSKGVNIK